MNHETYLQIDWEYAKENKIRVLRVYGSEPILTLPEQLGDCTLTEIGAYCFAKSPHLPGQYHTTIWKRDQDTAWQVMAQDEDKEKLPLKELCGSFLVELTLPEQIEKIGNLAFYDCVELRKLTIGKNMQQVGSDAFMNCHRLGCLVLQAGVREESGLRQILAQISWDIEVTFQKDGQMEAVLFYPEYFESYDEIAPAHIFGRNIEGEGFRARQSFLNGAVDFVQYDTIFPKACAEENDKTLQKIVTDRLLYPVDLKEVARERYETYFSKRKREIAQVLAGKRQMEQIRFFCERKLFDEEALGEAIAEAVKIEWTEGAAGMLSLKQELFATKAKERYSFDDF